MSMTKISKYIYPDNLEKSNFSYVDKPEIKKKSGESREEKETKIKTNKQKRMESVKLIKLNMKETRKDNI